MQFKPLFRRVLESRRHVRFREIGALEQEWFASRFSQRVRKAVAEVELCWMLAALSITLKGIEGKVRLILIDGFDLDTRFPEKVGKVFAVESADNLTARYFLPKRLRSDHPGFPAAAAEQRDPDDGPGDSR